LSRGARDVSTKVEADPRVDLSATAFDALKQVELSDLERFAVKK
jgi:hypothetical protein